ncbi:MAG: hypothetical protein FJY62_05890, partial [Betaproteobacteria bacterium]|nr:hypothetical protein [Betaproteobacteria bacterium]
MPADRILLAQAQPTSSDASASAGTASSVTGISSGAMIGLVLAAAGIAAAASGGGSNSTSGAGAGGGESPALFTVQDNSGAVSFGGAATGPITASISGTNVTFSRGGLSASTAVSGLGGKRLILAADQTLKMTLAQLQQLEGIQLNGAGDVIVDGTAAVGSQSVLLKVDLTGGDLTFDLPSDDNDAIVLESGSIIALNGKGKLIVDDGDVDLNAAAISGIEEIVINSGVRIGVSQLASLTGLKVVTANDDKPGRLDLVVKTADDVKKLSGLINGLFTVAPIFKITPQNDDPSVLQQIQQAIAENRESINSVLEDKKGSAYTGSAALVVNPPETTTGNSISFSTNYNANQVSFGGTATGAVSMALDGNGLAKFSRSGVVDNREIPTLVGTVKTTVNLDEGAALNVALTGTTASDKFLINAPKAGAFVLSGNTGSGLDEIVISVADPDTGAEISVGKGRVDVRVLRVDTSGLRELAGDKLVFDFAGDEDLVVIAADSNLAGFTTVEVREGTVDFHQVNVPANLAFIVNSGLSVRLEQLLAMESLASVTGLGRLTVIVDAVSQLDAASASIAAKVAANSSFLIGFGASEPGYIEVKVGETIVASNKPDALVSDPDAKALALISAISLGSLPSIPSLSALITGLQSQISGNDADIASLINDANANGGKATNASIAGLATTLSALDSAYKAADTSLLASVSAQFGSLTTNYQSAINSAITALKGTATETADTLGELQALISAVNALVTTINTNKLDAFDTLGEVGTAITTLQNLVSTLNGDASLAGSVTKAVNDSFNTLTANYQNAVKTLALTPTVSEFGGDLADGVLASQEGAVTIRVGLPQAASPSDSLHLYLGGVAIDLNGSTAGTSYLLLDGDITSGFKDFRLEQAALGNVGDKSVTAKISSGSVTGSSAALYFSYAPDASGPVAVASISDILADTGASDSDYITNQAIQTVSGTLSAALAAGEKVQVSANTTNGTNGNWFDAVVGGDQWIAQVILSSGSLYARTIDAAGNVTFRKADGTATSDFAQAQARSYTLDTTAPSAPAITDSQGANDGNVLTNDNTPTLVITAETGSTVGVYMNGAYVGDATETSTPGTFNFTSFELNDGFQQFKAKATDTAGNVSAASVAQKVTVDTQAVAGTLSIADLSNGFGSPLITSDPTFTLSLAGNEAGSTVVYKHSLDINGDGDFTDTGEFAWAAISGGTPTSRDVTGVDGTYQYKATVTDSAGNSADSNIVTLKVKATPPKLISVAGANISLTNGGNAINETVVLTLTFDMAVNGLSSGTNSTIFEVNEGGFAGVQATWSGANGQTTRTLTYTVAADQDGPSQVNVTALKAALVAGITSDGGIAFVHTANGGTIAVTGDAMPTVDGTPPNSPVINAVSTDDLINAAENTAGFSLTGTGEAGAHGYGQW